MYCEEFVSRSAVKIYHNMFPPLGASFLNSLYFLLCCFSFSYEQHSFVSSVTASRPLRELIAEAKAEVTEEIEEHKEEEEEEETEARLVSGYGTCAAVL